MAEGGGERCLSCYIPMCYRVVCPLVVTLSVLMVAVAAEWVQTLSEEERLEMGGRNCCAAVSVPGGH